MSTGPPKKAIAPTTAASATTTPTTIPATAPADSDDDDDPPVPVELDPEIPPFETTVAVAAAVPDVVAEPVASLAREATALAVEKPGSRQRVSPVEEEDEEGRTHSWAALQQ
ncbi:hypothetical protein SLS58_001349 [Diplodia intermedia]|uniref:Uncharacterized protein n=1 Tax=Diplodia intermedia TaxID=856260 RepID=A0ABR3U1Z8_9PEZI